MKELNIAQIALLRDLAKHPLTTEEVEALKIPGVQISTMARNRLVEWIFEPGKSKAGWLRIMKNGHQALAD
jgi:hypothetical protein